MAQNRRFLHKDSRLRTLPLGPAGAGLGTKKINRLTEGNQVAGSAGSQHHQAVSRHGSADEVHGMARGHTERAGFVGGHGFAKQPAGGRRPTWLPRRRCQQPSRGSFSCQGVRKGLCVDEWLDQLAALRMSAMRSPMSAQVAMVATPAMRGMMELSAMRKP